MIVFGYRTVAVNLAKRLDWFVDSDDFHPGADVEKMSNGMPLRARHEISVSNISCIWTNCIVPFSVERVGTNIYFFNLFF